MVTRRPQPLVQLCLLLALAASLTSACMLVVDHDLDRLSEFHFRTDGLGGRFEVWRAGEVTFTADDTAVAAITPGGFLRVDERRAFRTRRVFVEPGPTGVLTVSHTVNGRDQPDDARSREELADLFLRVIRSTAVGADQRVRRILARAGVDGVLDELDYVEGSTASSRYLTALLRLGSLDVPELIRVADQARWRISSSGTRASFLVAATPYFLSQDAAQDAYFSAASSLASSSNHQRVLSNVLERSPDRRTIVRLLRSARSISSSGNKSRVLVTAASRYENDDDLREAFFAAVDSMASSDNQTRVLLALLDRGPLDRVSAVSLLQSTTRISSSSSKAQVLSAVAADYSNDPDLREAYFAAVDSITSSDNRARALVALLDQGELDQASMVSLLRSAESISSSSALARVLDVAGQSFLNAPAPRDAFLRATASISSSGDRARVLVKLLSTEALDDAALEEVLRSVSGITSSSNQAQVLVAASNRVRGNGALLAVYVEVARGISSSTERRRVLDAVGRPESSV